jgi:multidrug efflux system membrane fusion protein
MRSLDHSAPRGLAAIRLAASRIASAAVAGLALAAGLAACNRKEQGPPPRPPVPVAVAAAITGTVPITLVSNGTVEPMQSVAVQPQTAGPVMAVRFAEGDEVRAGQVLFELDPRPAQAALAQARALVARDRATAAAARADADRYARLVSQGYVTQSQADQQRATAEAIGATIAGNEAAVRTAQLDLSYTTIRAPISGKTGAINVRVGNQVRVPNPVPLVTINSVAPVLVRFPVPDRALQEVRTAQRSGRKLEVVVSGAAVGGATERGVVDFIDNAIDTVSGSVTLKARFANTDRRLWPGAFVPLTLTLGQVTDAVLVPSVAVEQGPQGAYVFAPDAQGKARQVPVVVDRTVGDLAVVSKGLAAGDRVVVDGQSRLFPGAVLRVARTVDTPPPGAPAGGARTAGAAQATTAQAGDAPAEGGR